MNIEQQKNELSSDGRETARQAASPDAFALECLSESLRQARVLFWFSLTTGALAAAIELCVIVCAASRGQIDLPVVAKLILGLSFNAVALVAYRQAKDFRQWAFSLLINARLLRLTAPTDGPRVGVELPAELLSLLQHAHAAAARELPHKLFKGEARE